MSLAVCIIAHGKRDDLLDQICRSVMRQHPDEFLVIADTPDDTGWAASNGVKWMTVAPTTRTTVDALIKRDIGHMGSTSDFICYLADDHMLGPKFVSTFREVYATRDDWDILCPTRYKWIETKGKRKKTWLNMGEQENYVGGHAGIYRRAVNQQLPWMAGSHHRNWDLIQTRVQMQHGFRVVYADKDLAIEDIEPEFRKAQYDTSLGNLSALEAERMARAAVTVDDIPHEPGSTEPWVSRLVADFVIAIGAKSVLETGCFKGATSAYIYNALERLGGGDFTICDIDAERMQATMKRLREHPTRMDKVRCHWPFEGNGLDGTDVVRWLLRSTVMFDLVWLDDDHTPFHVSEEIRYLLPRMNPGGLILLHDVWGSTDLQSVVKAYGGYSIALPRIGPAGGIGVIQVPG